MDNHLTRHSGSLPMNPSHVVFHIVDSTENPFAPVVRTWNTWLMLDTASQQIRACIMTEWEIPLIHAGLYLYVMRIPPPLIEDTPRGGRKEFWCADDNACVNHSLW